MRIETINTRFPRVVDHLMNTALTDDDEDLVNVRGVQAEVLRGSMVDLVRAFGVTADEFGRIVTPTIYMDTHTTFRYRCPVLRGYGTGTTDRVVLDLKTAVLPHPLEYKQLDPVDRRDYINLSLVRLESDREPVRTSFDFYPNHFDRADTGFGDGIINSSVKVGDIAKLVALTGFLRDQYRKSKLVPQLEKEAMIRVFG